LSLTCGCDVPLYLSPYTSRCASDLVSSSLVFQYLLFLLLVLPPISTLFPYTTLFRSVSREGALQDGVAARLRRRRRPRARKPSRDRKSTRLNSSHQINSYAVFCLKKKQTGPPAERRPEEQHTDIQER